MNRTIYRNCHSVDADDVIFAGRILRIDTNGIGLIIDELDPRPPEFAVSPRIADIPSELLCSHLDLYRIRRSLLEVKLGPDLLSHGSQSHKDSCRQEHQANL